MIFLHLLRWYSPSQNMLFVWATRVWLSMNGILILRSRHKRLLNLADASRASSYDLSLLDFVFKKNLNHCLKTLYLRDQNVYPPSYFKNDSLWHYFACGLAWSSRWNWHIYLNYVFLFLFESLFVFIYIYA